jgi:WD40 repeat protein
MALSYLPYILPQRGGGIFSRWSIDAEQVVPLGEFSLNQSGFGMYLRLGLTHIPVIYLMENTVRIYDSLSGDLVLEFVHEKGSTGSFLISSDGSRFYINGLDGTVDVWDVSSGTRLNTFTVYSGEGVEKGQWMGFSEDETVLLTLGDDHVVRFWNAAAGQLIQEFKLDQAETGLPVLTPDNRFLLTCREDNAVLIREVASGKVVRSIQLSASPTALKVSPDGRFLLAGLLSFQTQVFDFATGRELVVLPGFAPFNSGSYQITPDNRYVFTTIAGDDAAYGFLLDNKELVKLACQRLAAVTLPDSRGKTSPLPICQSAQAKP